MCLSLSRVRWPNHIDKLVYGISKLCYVMNKLKYKLDRETLQTIYFTFVRPKLEYASIIWDDCPDLAKDRLENIQLIFARIVTGAKRGTSHHLLYNELSWPTLASRRHIAKLKFMHKIIHKNVPDYLTDVLRSSTSYNIYNLRNKGNLNQYATRTEKFKRSLMPDCISKWNRLSPVVRNIVSYKEFTKAISVNSTPCSLYYGISRKASIIHAQFRLHCSNLKFHLFSLHVTDNPNCCCSNQIEDCEHFFFKCFLHNIARNQFIEQINLLCTNVVVSTDLLLYGSNMLTIEQNKNLFALVEKYIIETGRF